jgi:hypothetical protein
MNPDGIYTFHSFGWDLLDSIRRAGFVTAEIGICYDVYCGFTSNNFPSPAGNMLPMVIRAIKR